MTISHPPSGRLPLLSARPAVTFPAAEHHHSLARIKLYCLVTEAHRCEQLAQGCYAAFAPSRIRTHDLLICYYYYLVSSIMPVKPFCRWKLIFYNSLVCVWLWICIEYLTYTGVWYEILVTWRCSSLVVSGVNRCWELRGWSWSDQVWRAAVWSIQWSNNVCCTDLMLM